MSLYEDIVNGKEKLSLVGLGYVGMPIAVAFARKIKVVGFDLNAAKIDLYKSGVDPTNEVGDDVIKNTTVEFTADPSKLREAKFHIVAVPTPVNDDHTPDLTPVEGASRILGQNLTLSVSNLVGLVGCPAASLAAFSLSRASCPFFAAQYSRSVIRSLLPFKRSIW